MQKSDKIVDKYIYIHLIIYKEYYNIIISNNVNDNNDYAQQVK